MKLIDDAIDANNNPLNQIPRSELLVWICITFISLFILRLVLVAWVNSYAGILSLSITLIVISIKLKQWGVSWAKLGLKKPDSYSKTALQLLCLIIATLIVALIAVFIAKFFFVKPEESSRFAGTSGNLPLTIWWIFLGWTIGGFAEEMLYRAFLISGLQRVLGGGKAMMALAIIIPGLFWAVRHIYFKGAYGAVFVFFVSLVFGCFYILTKRNLWPNVVMHGSMDMMGFISRF